MSKPLDVAKKKISEAASLLGAAHAQRHPLSNLKVLENLVAGVVRLAYAVEELEKHIELAHDRIDKLVTVSVKECADAPVCDGDIRIDRSE